MTPEAREAASKNPWDGYEAWLERGKKLCDGHSHENWNIGDWLVQGREMYDPKDYIPSERHMLLYKKGDGYASVKIPNFWKDISAKVGLCTEYLHSVEKVAREFPKKERIKRLPWSHHQVVMRWTDDKAKRRTYLLACLENLEEGERWKSTSWLCNYCEKFEVPLSEQTGFHTLSFYVPTEVWRKLKELAIYQRSKRGEIVRKPCLAAIEEFLRDEAKRISLNKFDFYEDGMWPLGAEGKKYYQAQERPKTWRNLPRRRRRKPYDPALSDRMRAAANVRWLNGPPRAKNPG